MKQIAPTHRPLMRQQGLVIDELPDEVLVYDLERHKAHCLNQTAALVWLHCDGRTTAAQIKLKIEKELGVQVDEKLVWSGLRQLGRDHLLEERIAPPPRTAGVPRLTRRQMVRALGVAAVVAVPIITSIISPTTADAASCAHQSQPCGVVPCCFGCSCSGGTCGGVC